VEGAHTIKAEVAPVTCFQPHLVSSKGSEKGPRHNQGIDAKGNGQHYTCHCGLGGGSHPMLQVQERAALVGKNPRLPQVSTPEQKTLDANGTTTSHLCLANVCVAFY